METFAERYRKLLEALGLNANEFANEVGFHNTKSYKFLKGESDPSYRTIQEILAKFPQINANYLVKGQLPILHRSGVEIVGAGHTKVSQVSLPLLEPTTDFHSSNGNYDLIVTESSDYNDAVVIRVTDNSMTPRYVPGMRLVARPVPVDDWEYLNSSLVLVLYRNVLVLRRIKENELVTRNYLTLYADSDTAGFVHVKREDLRSIWKVFDIIGAGSEL